MTGANAAPYVGSCPFLAADKARFFGRADEARKVAALWRDTRLTVLTGRSGVGKTSLLHAGVFPLVDITNADLLPVGRVCHETAFPAAALPEHNPYTLALLATWAPSEPQTRLSGFAVSDYLRRRHVRTDPYGKPYPVLATIDQAEDLFTGSTGSTGSTGRRHADWHRAAFIEGLAEALDRLPHVHLLLSIRDDYLDDFTRHQAVLSSVPVAVFTLSSLSPVAAAEAVRGSLEGTERSFAPGAAEALISGLGAGDVDPALLQVLCAGLWSALPDDVQEITSALVTEAADRVLATFCDRMVAAVAADQDLPPRELSAWLSQQFVAQPDTRNTVDEGTTHTAGMPNSVARALRDRHVLTAVPRSGARSYELRHDCLIDPVLRMRERVAEEQGTAFEPGPADFLRAAERAMADGDTGLAARHAAQALRRAADTDLRLRAEAESLLGNIAHAHGQLGDAEARYRTAAVLFEALRDTPAVAGLLAAIGQTLLAQGRYQEAIDRLHAAVGRIPNDLAVQTAFAWALWQAGHHGAAVAVLTGVLNTDGDTSDALRARGEILADLGRAQQALHDLDRVQRNQQPSTRAARGLALATLGRLSAAGSEVEAALSRAPHNGPVLVYAARVAALSGDPVGAADLARRAADATDPGIPPHLRRQALELMEAVVELPVPPRPAASALLTVHPGQLRYGHAADAGQRLRVVCRHGHGQQVALPVLAAHHDQQVSLHLVFDALGDHLEL